MRMKKIFGRVCVPDELDMIEHYRTPAEQTAVLIVHVVGLTLAAVGGIVLAVLAAIYVGIGAVMATARRPEPQIWFRLQAGTSFGMPAPMEA